MGLAGGGGEGAVVNIWRVLLVRCEKMFETAAGKHAKGSSCLQRPVPGGHVRGLSLTFDVCSGLV